MQAQSTSLSTLSNHDWNILKSRNARGIDWMVGKVGRKWVINGDIPQIRAFPLFRTKSAAYEAINKLIIAEALFRALSPGECDACGADGAKRRPSGNRLCNDCYETR